MGVDFDIKEKEGPVLPKMTTMADVERIKSINPSKSTPFVAEALRNLRREVGNKATVLGFVGLPYTLATYLVEGGSSAEYKHIKVNFPCSLFLQFCLLIMTIESIADTKLSVTRDTARYAGPAGAEHRGLCDFPDRGRCSGHPGTLCEVTMLFFDVVLPA